MTTALVFLAILMVAVVIHELAHYLNARSVGLEVKAFSVGMGPVIWRKMWRGTEWRISLLPIGGYVDLPGMAPETDEDGNLRYAENGFSQKNLWQKLWILIGGVIANYVLAVLLLSFVISQEPFYRSLTLGLGPDEVGTVFSGVNEGSAAEQLGIQSRDVVLELNGVVNPSGSVVSETIKTADVLDFRLERNGNPLTISTPWPLEPPQNPSESPMLGVYLSPNYPKINYWQAINETLAFTVRIIPDTVRSIFKSFGQTFTLQQAEEVAGPVGMVKLVNQATRDGPLTVLLVAALINFSLAIFNLLPIPALDGGRMLMAIIVAIRGKPLPPGREEMIHFMGFALLIAFMLLLTSNEIMGLFRN
ncbi:MAG: M50 family metallopeptidase [Deinococcales bacterium]